MAPQSVFIADVFKVYYDPFYKCDTVKYKSKLNVRFGITLK